MLAGVGHHPQPCLARHRRPVRVQADQLGLRGLGAAADGPGDVGPQVALVVPETAGRGPAVRTVRDAAGADPPFGGLGVHAAAERQVVDGDACPQHGCAQPFVHLPHSTGTFRDVSSPCRDVSARETSWKVSPDGVGTSRRRLWTRSHAHRDAAAGRVGRADRRVHRLAHLAWPRRPGRTQGLVRHTAAAASPRGAGRRAHGHPDRRRRGIAP